MRQSSILARDRQACVDQSRLLSVCKVMRDPALMVGYFGCGYLGVSVAYLGSTVRISSRHCPNITGPDLPFTSMVDATVQLSHCGHSCTAQNCEWQDDRDAAERESEVF